MITIRKNAWDARAASSGGAVNASTAALRLIAGGFDVSTISGGEAFGPGFFADDGLEWEAVNAMAEEKAAPPVKRKPGRPRTGVTPLAERKRKSAEALLKAGGRRLEIRLTPDGAQHLEEVHKDHPGLNDTEALLLAIRWYATRRSRKLRE